jgi:hypothetical protein
MENSNLLRIGILILVGFILYQVIKRSNILGNNSFFANGTDKGNQGTNDQLTMVEQKVRLDDGPQYDNQPAVRPHEQTTSQLYDYNYQVLPYPQIATSPQDSYFNQGGVCQPSDPGCYSGSTLQAPDLLPTDIGDNAWQETSPTAQGHITDQNFLESGHHYGINTVGNSLKNPNTQLRSDPPIPKVNVSPWLNSTVDPDTNRKAFEIQD